MDGLLSLARADAAEASPASVDLNEVVRGRFAAWAARAEAIDVALQLDVPVGLRAAATPGSLDQVLDNLLANALVASPQGGRVSVRATRVETFVELHVADEGPGLTARAASPRLRPLLARWADVAGNGTGPGYRPPTRDGGRRRARAS